jgi:methionyl-tRNA synthetase
VRYLNAELADTFGNLLSRACAKTLNPQQKFPQVHSDHVNELIKLDSCKIMLEKLDELSTVCRKHFENYHFHFVVDTVLAALHTSNNFFETTKPWELKNKDEESTRKLETIISMTMESLRISATILQPIIPDFTNRLLTRLNIPTEQRFWKDTKLYLRNVEHNLKDLENNILFQRIIIKNNEQQEKLKSVKKEKVKKKN